MIRLSRSDQHILRPAVPLWLAVAILRLGLRTGWRQETIRLEARKAPGVTK